MDTRFGIGYIIQNGAVWDLHVKFVDAVEAHVTGFATEGEADSHRVAEFPNCIREGASLYLATFGLI